MKRSKNNFKRSLQKVLSLISICFLSSVLFAQESAQFKKPNWLQCDLNNELEKRIFYEYGAVFVSVAFDKQKKLVPCLFENEAEIEKFALTFKTSENKFDFGDFYLQTLAKNSLEKVFAEMGGYQNVARNDNKTTSATNGINDDWAFRTYEQTKCNWLGLGNNLARCQNKTLDFAKIELQVKDQKSTPKMFSTAIPGGSQHHFGLAVDVNNGTGHSSLKNCQKQNKCRSCGSACISSLEKHGWFRTVKYDPFHFTFLGFKKSELPSKGLKEVKCQDGKNYWIPNVPISVYAGYQKRRCQDV